MATPLIVSEVSKSFTMHLRGGLVLPVISNVSFSVAAGECVVLGGPSGIGKSSVLKMLYGNYAVDHGQILVNHAGRIVDIASADPRTERHFGLADRIRYYWPAPTAQAAVQHLLADLADKRLPDPMLAAHFAPVEIASARASAYPLPRALALARVQTALRPYFFTGPRS